MNTLRITPPPAGNSHSQGFAHKFNHLRRLWSAYSYSHFSALSHLSVAKAILRSCFGWSNLRPSLLLVALMVMMSVQAWGETIIIDVNNINMQTVFPCTQSFSKYEYGDNSNIATWNLISIPSVPTDIVFSNPCGHKITSIKAEGVVDDNNNKTVTMSCIVGNKDTDLFGSSSWYNRKNTSLTSKTKNSLSITTDFSIRVKGYKGGYKFTITYTEGECSSTYTVSFDTHGGGSQADITQVSAGASITLPAAPTKTGYTFNGWFDAETGGNKVGNAGASYTPTTDITLHAQWTEVVIPATEPVAPSVAAEDVTVTQNGTATTLDATPTNASDCGILSYQWYSNNANSNEDGTAISGATSAEYTPSTATAGETYYYCVITNTQNGQTAAAKTAPVKVTVNAASTEEPCEDTPKPTTATLAWTTEPADGTVGDADAMIAATTNSTGTIEYSSSDESVATIVDGKIHYVAAGTVTITASVAADGNYTAATISKEITVSAAAEPPAPAGCETFFYFVKAADATANHVTNTDKFSGVPSDGGDLSAEFSYDGTTYKLTRRSSNSSNQSITFTVPEGYTGELMVVHGTNNKKYTLSSTALDEAMTPGLLTQTSCYSQTFENLPAGNYTLSNGSSNNIGIAALILKLCSTTPQTRFFIRGNGSGTWLDGKGWDTSTPCEMTKIEGVENQYVLRTVLHSNSEYTYNFQIFKGDSDFKVKPLEDATSFDLNNQSANSYIETGDISFTATKAMPVLIYLYDWSGYGSNPEVKVMPEDVYVVGDEGLTGTSWGVSDAGKMNKVENDNTHYIWSKENLAAGTYDFKLLVGNRWYNAATGDCGFTVPTGTNNISLTTCAAGDVSINFELSTDAQTIAVTSTAPLGTEVYTVVGSSTALFGGNAWEVRNDNDLLVKDEAGNWTKTFEDIYLTAGDIEWKVYRNHCASGEGGCGNWPTNNATLNIPANGYYNVTFRKEPCQDGSAGSEIGQPTCTLTRVYHVTFHANGENVMGTMADATTADGTVNLPECAFEKVGFVFQGWATTKGGTVVYTDAQANIEVAGDMDLYAVWAQEESCITFINFATGQYYTSNNDARKEYVYTDAITDESDYIIVTNSSSNKGQNNGKEQRVDKGTFVEFCPLKADKTVGTFAAVRTVTLKYQFHQTSTQTTGKLRITIGSYSEEIAIDGNKNTSYKRIMVQVPNAAQQNATVKIENISTANNSSVYIDDVEICSTQKAPTITVRSPLEEVYMRGDTYDEMVVTSSGYTSLQWFWNTENTTVGATAIEGATGLTYTPTYDIVTSGGTYYFFCMASNEVGTTTSDIITLVQDDSSAACITFGSNDDRDVRVTGETTLEAKDGIKVTATGVSFSSEYASMGSNDNVIRFTAPAGSYFTAVRFYAGAGGSGDDKIRLHYADNHYEPFKVSSTSKTEYTAGMDMRGDEPPTEFWIKRNGTQVKLYEVCVEYAAVGFSLASMEEVELCGGSATLTAVPQNTPDGATVTYAWTKEDDETFSAEGIECTVSEAGTYTVTATTSTNETATQSVVVRVSPPHIAAAAGTNLNGCNGDGVTLQLLDCNDDPVTTGTFAWYRDGNLLSENTGATITVTIAATYTAKWNGVDVKGSAVVSAGAIEALPITKLVQRHYYQVDSVYEVPARKVRHLAVVDHTTIPNGVEVENGYWSANIRIFHKATGTVDNADVSGLPTGLFFNASAEGATIDTICIDYDVLTAWHTTNSELFGVGDELRINIKALTACGFSEAVSITIPVIVLPKTLQTLGYVVSGAVNGGIFDVRLGDLSDPLFSYLQTEYVVDSLNGYATFNKFNYEVYDLVLLTDYPKATGEGSQPDKVNALAGIVDYRPMLTLKAHMSALDAWKAKGFITNAEVPTIPKTTMTILCESHDIFKDVEHEDINHDGYDNMVVLSQTVQDGDKMKGVQGFRLEGTNFLNIASITDTTYQSDGVTVKDIIPMVACCERQEVVEARLVVLSINNLATKYLTDNGKKAIDNLLEYLLITGPENVSDCSIYFDNGAGNPNVEGEGDHLWRNPANWGPNYTFLPRPEHNVRIEAEVRINGNEMPYTEEGNINGEYDPDNFFTVKASTIKIRRDPENHINGKIIVRPTGTLYAYDEIVEVRGHNFMETYPITDPDLLVIEAGTPDDPFPVKFTGSVAFDGEAPVATIQQYYSVYTPDTAVNYWNWKYIGVPCETNATNLQNFNLYWGYYFGESDWVVAGKYETTPPFKGMAVTQTNWKNGRLLTFQGKLINGDQSLAIRQTSGTLEGFDLLANSYAAPIDISLMEPEDFENADPVIYIYHTGSKQDWYDNDGSTNTAGEDNRQLPGTYCTYSVLSTEAVTEQNIHQLVIPTGQGFLVKHAENNTDPAYLHLNYKKHVYGRIEKETVTADAPLRAPSRNKHVNVQKEWGVLNIYAQGTIGADKLSLAEYADLSIAYDRGYDAEKMLGDTRVPQIYSLALNKQLAVDCRTSIDSALIGVQAGDFDTIVTLSFCGGNPEKTDALNNETYKLLDLFTGAEMVINAVDTYTYEPTENDAHGRFLIVRNANDDTPEPTTSLIQTADGNYRLPITAETKVLIYDAVGHLVASQILTPDNAILHMEQMPQGCYLLNVTANMFNQVFKVVK